MLCTDPVTVGSHHFPCGRCEPCRINRKRLWTNRILLEAGEHGDNSFWTLTYDDKNLPLITNGLSTLAPEDTRNFMKRIRAAVAQKFSGTRLRFYLVGEYGDGSERPHYHLALFGYPRCSNGVTLRHRGRPLADRCCVYCRLVSSTWGKGDVDGGGLEEGSAQYLVGYVLKKMTRYDDIRLYGRMPEFARMSLRPGIGQRAMHDIADVILQLDLDESEADVPSALRRGSRVWPLGRYLQNQLRKMTGTEKEKWTYDEKIREAHERFTRLQDMFASKGLSRNPTKSEIVEAFKQDVLNRSKRQAIFRKRGSI